MTRYRILHKPTGLFYCPARSIRNQKGEYVKSNLSKKGKIYHTYPSLKWCTGNIATHQTNLQHKAFQGLDQNYYIEAPIKDWEIIEEGKEPVPLPNGISDEEKLKVVIEQAIKDYSKTVDVFPWAPGLNSDQCYELYLSIQRAIKKHELDFNLEGAL